MGDRTALKLQINSTLSGIGMGTVGKGSFGVLLWTIAAMVILFARRL